MTDQRKKEPIRPAGASGPAALSGLLSRGLARPDPTSPPGPPSGPVSAPSSRRSTGSGAVEVNPAATSGPGASSLVIPTPLAGPGCGRCDGKGYLLQAVGDRCQAKVCSCQGKCTVCKGSGFVLESDEAGYIFHRPCDCQRLGRRVATFNQALIPSHYTHKDLNSFEPGEGTAHVHEWLKTYARGYPADRAGVLLVGPPGVGKTHLVVGALKVLTLEKGVRCLFKDFLLLISEVKEAYETGRFETEVLRPLAEVDVLVVDELGKGRSNSDWEQGLLDEIICKRYNQLKTTLLTTNFPLEATRERQDENRRGLRPMNGLGNLTSSQLMPTLEERVGERIFSRLKQMCTFLRVEAPDYRRTHGPGNAAWTRR